MKRKGILMAALLLLCAGAAQAADQLKVTVKNPLATDRNGEMVELALADIEKKLGTTQVIVTDADGREVASQQTWDGKLIFQVGVGGKGQSVYYVQPGTPQGYEAKVFGRQFPERVDDMGWENDRVAFRAYGPQLQRNGERAFGYDIWNKRTDKLVINDRYAGELDAEIASVCRKLRARGENDLADDLYNAVSYHVDHGNGMDCYKVGPTLGAGADALLSNGGQDIVFPYCYESFEILDQGPLRFTVKLVYEQKEYEGQQQRETRLISLDAGSQLNKAVVSFDGLTQTAPLAVGIVVHPENPNAFVLSQENGYMGYEDLGDPNQYKEKYRAKQNAQFGKIYVGAVCPQAPKAMEYRALEGVGGTSGHILAISDLAPQTAFTYYFGSGWSRNPATAFQSLTDWEAYLADFAQRVKTPLKVSLK